MMHDGISSSSALNGLAAKHTVQLLVKLTTVDKQTL
jgi:hypothetical protein